MTLAWGNTKPVARRFWIHLALAVGVILIVAAASRAQQSDSTRNDVQPATASQQAALAGTWKLNRDESDDPREKLRSAIQDRNRTGNPGGMGRRGGIGGGGIGMGIPGIGGMGGNMGRPGGGQSQSSASDEQHARVIDLVEPPNQLGVAQKGPEIDMTDTDSHTRENRETSEMPIKIFSTAL